MIKKKFEFLEHTADIKIRIYGKSIEEIFENAVLALSNYISRGQKIKSKIVKKIKVNGADMENLLLNFLDETIYLFDARNFIISKAKVRIKDKKLDVELFGDRASNYKELDQVKAATYHEMYIKKLKAGRWEAQFVIDV